MTTTILEAHRPAIDRRIPIFGTEATRSEMMAIYEDKLRRWPVPFDAFHIPTRYGRTHVIASGDLASPPLLLLHPATGGGVVWSSVIAALCASHRTYAIDTIGDANKSELDDIDHRPDSGRDYSDWLEDIYIELDLGTADVVAASMGGWIALHHAIHAPDRVSRLALLGPMGLPPFLTMMGVLGPMLWAAIHPTIANRERIIDRALGDGERVNREYRTWMRLVRNCKLEVAIPTFIPARELRKISVPTLVFLGGKDGLVGDPAATARRARAHIAGCEIEILPAAGHVMSIDEPDAVSARVLEFLDREEPDVGTSAFFV